MLQTKSSKLSPISHRIKLCKRAITNEQLMHISHAKVF